MSTVCVTWSAANVLCLSALLVCNRFWCVHQWGQANSRTSPCCWHNKPDLHQRSPQFAVVIVDEWWGRFYWYLLGFVLSGMIHPPTKFMGLMIMEINHVKISRLVNQPSKDCFTLLLFVTWSSLVWNRTARLEAQICFIDNKGIDDMSWNLSQWQANGGSTARSITSVAVEVMMVSLTHSTWMCLLGWVGWWLLPWYVTGKKFPVAVELTALQRGYKPVVMLTVADASVVLSKVVILSLSVNKTCFGWIQCVVVIGVLVLKLTSCGICTRDLMGVA